MKRQTWDRPARRSPHGRRRALVAGLLLAAAAVPLAAPPPAGAGPGPGAGPRPSAVCAPFDYSPYSDRQPGVTPGERVVRIESPNGGYRYERLNTEGYVRL